jgi:hypothetical protein
VNRPGFGGGESLNSAAIIVMECDMARKGYPSEFRRSGFEKELAIHCRATELLKKKTSSKGRPPIFYFGAERRPPIAIARRRSTRPAGARVGTLNEQNEGSPSHV